MAVGIAVLFFLLPLVGLLLRTPWSELGTELASPPVRSALRLSLVCSLAATGISLVFGVPLAWALARWEFPGRSLVRALTTLPMVVPPVVGGVALLLAFGRRGFAGRWLDEAFGVTLPFTTAGRDPCRDLRRHALPGDHRRSGPEVDGPAVRGCSRHPRRRPWVTFRRVTLPLIAPSLGRRGRPGMGPGAG